MPTAEAAQSVEATQVDDMQLASLDPACTPRADAELLVADSGAPTGDDCRLRQRGRAGSRPRAQSVAQAHDGCSVAARTWTLKILPRHSTPGATRRPRVRADNGVTPIFGTLSSRPFMQTVAHTVAPPAHNIFTFSHRASRIRSSHPRPRASTPMPTHDQHPGLPFPSSSLLDSAVFSFVLSSKTF